MRRILALLLTLSIISCATDNNYYNLDGNALGFADNTQIYVYTISDNNQSKIIDTLTVKNESFSGKYPKEDVLSIKYLQIKNIKGNILYFPENTDLKVTLFKDSIQSSFVTGGHQNDLYKQYSYQLKEFNKKKSKNIEAFKQARKEQDNLLANEIKKENDALINEENNYKKQFVTENSNSLLTVLLLTEMVSRKEISSSEATSIMNNLSPKVAATSSSKKLKNLISSMKKADIGGKAPNFTAPSPEGDMVSLYNVLGKYTIIDFWASWCKPCRRENPNVVKVYNKYHEKGLNIISVSLDKQGQKERWIKAIEDDNLTWHHVSNLKFWSDPIAKNYNVRAIPATFLLDEKGNIIAKNLRGNALEVKMAQLLGN